MDRACRPPSLLVGALYLLFSVGFSAISGFVLSAGGFYSYIRAGLGPVVGLGGALIARATYTNVAVAVYGLFGFFLNDLVGLACAPDIAWWIYAVALAITVFPAVCGASSSVAGFWAAVWWPRLRSFSSSASESS